MNDPRQTCSTKANRLKPQIIESQTNNANDRLTRLLRLLITLQTDLGCNVRQLASSLRVSERTIFRDLHSLSQAGLRPRFDRRKRIYRLDRPLYLPMDLAVDEAMALTVLIERIAGREQIPFTTAARRAVAKISASLPEAIRREVAMASKHTDIVLAAATPPDESSDAYDRVQRAIRARRALRCAYQSPKADGATESFMFHPYVTFFAQRAWYAVGWHSGRSDVRTLKLPRFVAITETDETYEIPPSFSLKKDVIGNAWRMIRGDQSYDVEILFDAQFADGIEEVHWHDTQTIEPLDGGGLVFRCRVDGLNEILWWVLSMGSHCRVIQPAELAERVKEEAKKLAAMYGNETQRKKRLSASGKGNL